MFEPKILPSNQHNSPNSPINSFGLTFQKSFGYASEKDTIKNKEHEKISESQPDFTSSLEEDKINEKEASHNRAINFVSNIATSTNTREDVFEEKKKDEKGPIHNIFKYTQPPVQLGYHKSNNSCASYSKTSTMTSQ